MYTFRNQEDQKKLEDLCEQIRTFFESLRKLERKEAGEQLIQCLILDTTFGMENIKTLLDFVKSLLDKLCPPPYDTPQY